MKKDEIEKLNQKIQDVVPLETNNANSHTDTLHCNGVVTKCNTEKEKEIEIEIEKKEKKKKKLSIDECTEKILLKKFDAELEQKLIEWIQYKNERREFYTETGLKSFLSIVSKNIMQYGNYRIINLIDTCMANTWKGIIYEKLENVNKSKNSNDRPHQPLRLITQEDLK